MGSAPEPVGSGRNNKMRSQSSCSTIASARWAAPSICVEHALQLVRVRRVRETELEQNAGLLRQQVVGGNETRLLPVDPHLCSTSQPCLARSCRVHAASGAMVATALASTSPRSATPSTDAHRHNVRTVSQYEPAHAQREKFDYMRRKICPSLDHLAHVRQQFPERQSTATMTIGASRVSAEQGWFEATAKSEVMF